MTTILLFGILVATFATLAVTGFHRIPTRSRCPECGRATEAVLPPPWLQPGQRWVSMRWCVFCAWEGVGRKGPDLVPGRQISHDSGFHWGADQTGPNQGFAWKSHAEPEPMKEPPHHVSGFRFSEIPPDTRPPKAHGSGFRWSPDPVSPDPVSPDEQAVRLQKAHRTGFHWATETPQPTFRFKEGNAPARPGGFRWKGVA